MIIEEAVDCKILLSSANPDEREQEGDKNILKRYVPDRPYAGQEIGGIVTQYYDIHYLEKIENLADDIYDEMKSVKTSYFFLVNHDQTFAGIFSTRNMLVYLSEMMHKDIIHAKTVQSNIVNDHQYVETPRFDFFSFVCMAKETGGDYYYIRQYKQNKWIVSICDVSGKGIAASLVTSVIGGMMSIYDFFKRFDYFISCLNDYIYNTFGPDRCKMSLVLVGPVVYLIFNEHSGCKFF